MKLTRLSLAAEPIRVSRRSVTETASVGATTNAGGGSTRDVDDCSSRRHAVARHSPGAQQWTDEDLSRLGEDILSLSRDYVMYKVAVFCNQDEFDQPVSRYAAVMRKVAQLMEARHPEVFEDMMMQLDMKRTTAYEVFEGVVRGMFIRGMNWGRFVALYCFAGNVAVRCAIDADMADLVPSVITWLARFVSRDLGEWICDNGGLVSFQPEKCIFRAVQSLPWYKKVKLETFVMEGKIIAGTNNTDVMCLVLWETAEGK